MWPLPMDIPKENWYLICNVQRKGRSPQEIGSASGHTRSDDFENATGDGPTARIRDRPPAGAVERRSAPLERGHGLHLPVAAAAGGMDCGGMGRFGEQPK